MPSSLSEHRFVSFDETPVFYRHLSPPSPKALLFILHGMGEHGGRYAEIAAALAGAGLECYLPDFRGFGQSGGGRGALKRFEDYFRDLEALLRLAKQRSPGLPVFILAHSMGGLIAAAWLAQKPAPEIRGLVLSSPNFGLAKPPSFGMHVLATALSYFLPEHTESNRVNHALLTHDKNITERYSFDRWNHSRISTRLYREMTRQQARKGEIAERLALPTLILQAGDDRVVSEKDTRLFFQVLASRDKQLEVFPGLYHEILNESSRADIYALIQRWLLKRI